MAQIHVFTVQAHPPSPNTTRGLHWGTLIRRQKALREEVGWKARAAAMTLPGPLQRVSVTFLFQYHGGRFRDEDNAIASVKPLVDALKDGGLIVDDSPEHMTLRVYQRRAAQTALIIEVMEVF